VWRDKKYFWHNFIRILSLNEKRVNIILKKMSHYVFFCPIKDVQEKIDFLLFSTGGKFNEREKFKKISLAAPVFSHSLSFSALRPLKRR
jgi:hypothetical protein